MAHGLNFSSNKHEHNTITAIDAAADALREIDSADGICAQLDTGSELSDTGAGDIASKKQEWARLVRSAIESCISSWSVDSLQLFDSPDVNSSYKRFVREAALWLDPVADQLSEHLIQVFEVAAEEARTAAAEAEQRRKAAAQFTAAE